MRTTLPLIMFAPLAKAQSETADWYVATWAFLSVMLFFYTFIACITYPRTRARVPLLLFFAIFLFPPGFLLMALYFVCIVTTVEAATVISEPQPVRQVVIMRELDGSNRVVRQ